MKLESITLKNYRLFSELTCDFHPELTVFVANNGGGKTSILDAIRVAYGTYLGAFPSGNGVGIHLSDVRQIKSQDELALMDRVFPSEIHATGTLRQSDRRTSWFRAVNTSKSGTTIKDARELATYAKDLQSTGVQEIDKTNWPLLAYYGTGRLWSQKKLTAAKMFLTGYDSRTAAYMDCMEPASSYKYFVEWFGYAYRSITQSKIRFMEANPNATAQEVTAHQSAFSPLVSAVQEAVNTVLAPSGWKNLWYSETDKEVTVVHDQFGKLAGSQLSDGIRNTLALVADIAFRAVHLNPHLGNRAAKDAQGIVLIDEVDMHLHPSWQQTILANLRDAFPRLQFIVTTHSPQVLTSVDRSCIRLLQQETDVKTGKLKTVVNPVLLQTLGVSSTDLLAQIMGVDPIPDVPEARLLSEYHALIQQNLHESLEGKEQRNQLESHFGAEHPVMRECDRMIRLQILKQKLPMSTPPALAK